jgi:hypothetical protein
MFSSYQVHYFDMVVSDTQTLFMGTISKIIYSNNLRPEQNYLDNQIRDVFHAVFFKTSILIFIELLETIFLNFTLYKNNLEHYLI